MSDADIIKAKIARIRQKMAIAREERLNAQKEEASLKKRLDDYLTELTRVNEDGEDEDMPPPTQARNAKPKRPSAPPPVRTELGSKEEEEEEEEEDDDYYGEEAEEAEEGEEEDEDLPVIPELKAKAAGTKRPNEFSEVNGPKKPVAFSIDPAKIIRPKKASHSKEKFL